MDLKKTYLPFNCPYFTLENHCTRTAQSSLGGCSRRVYKIVYLAVKKGTTRDVFYVHIVEDLMKTAKVNAYIMYIYKERLSFYLYMH